MRANAAQRYRTKWFHVPPVHYSSVLPKKSAHHKNKPVGDSLALVGLCDLTHLRDFARASLTWFEKEGFVVLAQPDQIVITETAQIRFRFRISSHYQSGSVHENANCFDSFVPRERAAEVKKAERWVRTPTRLRIPSNQARNSHSAILRM